MPQPPHRDGGRAGAPADEADRLYGLPLDQFVKERDELARRLRHDGRPEDASRVAKLPKPSVPAWAANQVLRSQLRAARELRAAGAALSDTQSAALRGRADPRRLRDAIDRHRAALADMVQAASGLLDSRGRSLSPATLERVRSTLAAASLDPDLAPEAEQGRLVREHLYTGLAELASAPGVEAPKADTARPSDRRPATAPTDAGGERREGEAAGRRDAAKLKAARRRDAAKLGAARRRDTAKLKAARERVAATKKRARAAVTARDLAAREARTAALAHERAERRLSQALDAQARARSHLDVLEAAEEA
ncbi:MAG TPA: hypothetical protein VGN08_09115 [Solirubrobacteraceae bacterium]|jgi:hypothetical protein